MRNPEIDAEFVRRWSDRYKTPPLEQRLLNDVGPAVAARGYYHRQEFLDVGRWKSSRSKPYLNRNRDEDIEDITRLALAAPERLRHRILDLLAGVGIPMASALLAVADTSRFTVIDFRAIETLRAHGELASKRPSYTEYLAVCHTVADRVRTDLRTLDRALWQWSQDGGDESSRRD
jgi:hypothetical protein